QNANEELQTTKEEAQAINEELTTINDELKSRMEELSQRDDDLYNVLSGVGSAVVIVGMDLRISRYAGAAEKLLNLSPEDIGQSASLIDNFLGSDSLEPKLATVIQTLSTVESEVLATDGRWYALKLCPYKTQGHAVRGALVIFVDIDFRKNAQATVQQVAS